MSGVTFVLLRRVLGGFKQPTVVRLYQAPTPFYLFIKYNEMDSTLRMMMSPFVAMGFKALKGPRPSFRLKINGHRIDNGHWTMNAVVRERFLLSLSLCDFPLSDLRQVSRCTSVWKCLLQLGWLEHCVSVSELQQQVYQCVTSVSADHQPITLPARRPLGGQVNRSI